MNKAQEIQRSKLNSAYGGVGSTIDTIDNLAYEVQEVEDWGIHKRIIQYPNKFPHLLAPAIEERLLIRLQNIGYSKVNHLFLTEDTWSDDITLWKLGNEKYSMVNARYFPRMFYCPKCHRIELIEDWENNWNLDQNWDSRVPKCYHCSKRTGNKIFGPNLIQVRFVLASMETGHECDIPWDMIHGKKGTNDGIPGVWDFVNKPVAQATDTTFNIAKGSSDLIDIYVKANDVTVTMAEIMNHYFIMRYNGRPAVYRPVVRSANNVYFPYVISSVYIPKHPAPDQQTLDKIKVAVEEDGWEASKISKRYSEINLSVSEVQAIIDNNYSVPQTDYSTEEAFRLDEFDCLTDDGNYVNGVFADQGKRLISEKYNWVGTNSLSFIKQLYLLRNVNVTSALVAYSRIDKVSISNLSHWKGKSDNPKYWYNLNTNTIDQNVEVALHPICKNKNTIDYFPVVSQNGEGFFIEFDKEYMPDDEKKKEIFLHTFSHLVMKSLEFSCGYPISSMTERLYILPQSLTSVDGDRYGVMIYSANGEAGSYGGITSLFETQKIESILHQALESAVDCPNDPICEEEGGSCFACVQVPETACELFNSKLSRNVILEHLNGLCAKNSAATSQIVGSAVETNGSQLVNNITCESSKIQSEAIILA